MYPCPKTEKEEERKGEEEGQKRHRLGMTPYSQKLCLGPGQHTEGADSNYTNAEVDSRKGGSLQHVCCTLVHADFIEIGNRSDGMAMCR